MWRCNTIYYHEKQIDAIIIVVIPDFFYETVGSVEISKHL